MLVTDNQTELSALMAELQEEAVLNLVRQCLADGVDPLVIIDLCHKGMIQVGEYYEQGHYFISGLIMAGEIMHQVGQLVFPLLASRITNGDSGTIVLGTVEGDIHFVGKDIFKFLVRVHGFTVHDLGVDVPPSQFLAAIHEFKPNIVGLSCLISTVFKSLRETVAFLKKNIPQYMSPPAYVIGGRVDEIVCKDVGADYWTNDGMKGVRLCQKIMGKS
ncbi:MAG: cobalamin-dependent protein [Deltaproteobacteria bacterium]|nr:cobalamin-dependent protein [Deltaproteobacteria bacterium]